jgi:hypothetical protein
MTEPPVYAPPPPYKPRPEQAGRARPGRRTVIVVAAIVLVIAGGVLAYFLSSSSPSGAATPVAAVQRLLDAGRRNDVAKARSVLCSGDRALGQLSHLPSSGTIATYKIGTQSVVNHLTVVQASYTTSTSAVTTTETFPVVKENGSWKVCFTKAIASVPGQPSTLSSSGGSGSSGSLLPSASVTLPSGLPSGLGSLSGAASLCSGSTSGFGVASTYLGAVALRVLPIAQACVYHNQVPESVTTSLAGTLFRPVTTDQNASVIDFASTVGAKKVRVRTARESDGLYYVIDVTVS